MSRGAKSDHPWELVFHAHPDRANGIPFAEGRARETAHSEFYAAPPTDVLRQETTGGRNYFSPSPLRIDCDRLNMNDSASVPHVVGDGGNE